MKCVIDFRMPPRWSTWGKELAEEDDASGESQYLTRHEAINLLDEALQDSWTPVSGASDGTSRGPPEPGSAEGRMFEQFWKLNPPVFAGRGDPGLAESWLRQIQKFFAYLNTPEEVTNTFAIFQLIDFADSWWRGISANEMGPISWDRFVALFEQEYFPISLREKKH